MNEKFVVAVDLEGLACVVGSYGRGLADSPDYDFAALQGTREAAAAVNALFDNGASDVIVWDCHGTGVNLKYAMLDKRVRIAIGAGSRVRFPGMDSSFDGVLFIGYHAYDVPKATLAHVYSSSTFTSHLINGKPVGELQLDAAIAGKRGVKTMFVSSDDICVSQATESFPWAETVVTKEALAWNSCISRHPDAVCDDIYAAVTRAYTRMDEMREFTLPTPFELSVSYKRIEYAQGCNLHNPDGTPFDWTDAYTRKGILADPEDYFLY